MHIGIITLFHKNYNYGAALQAYSLQQAIQKLGHTSNIIDYERCITPIDPIDNSFKSRLKKKAGSIRCIGDIIDMLFRYIPENKYKPDINRRQEKFQKFYKSRMKISSYYNIGTIYLANNEFDAFISGSDQVWRPGSFDKNYYLDFADKQKKRISYAASLGVSELSDTAKKIMIPLIRKFHSVSVRENEAAALLKKELNSDVKTVVDPTLLWDKPFWNNISSFPKNIEKQKYIFCYFIGENNHNRNIAKKLSKMTGYPLFSIPGISRLLPYDFKYADKNIIDASPEEFIGLIQNAEIIISDSYHACVFSIIFDRPFFAVERYLQSDINSMNGRIYDLLKMFHLENHLIRSNQNISTELFNTTSPKMEDYIHAKDISWNYLETSLVLEQRKSSEVYKTPFGVYAAQNLNIGIRKTSSSGGIFYEVAKKILDENGVVIACRMDEHGRAIHDICNRIVDLPEYMTSKYVQSDIGNSMKIAKEHLKGGSKVLFVGTPCQTAGLRRYIKLSGINDKNLFVIDFICHGVPSPFVWKEYLKSIAGQECVEIQQANFRYPFYGWRKFALSVESAYFSHYLKSKEEDLYIRGFLNNLFLRPSCYSCKYKSLIHNSDITLGDFWHYENFPTSIKDDDTGISIVIIQSEKGAKLFEKIKENLEIAPVSFDILAKVNKNMFVSPIMTKERESFFCNYQDFCAAYSGNSCMMDYLDSLIGDSLTDKTKRLIKKIIGR